MIITAKLYYAKIIKLTNQKSLSNGIKWSKKTGIISFPISYSFFPFEATKQRFSPSLFQAELLYLYCSNIIPHKVAREHSYDLCVAVSCELFIVFDLFSHLSLILIDTNFYFILLYITLIIERC